MESLLSYIEFTQFQNYLGYHIDMDCETQLTQRVSSVNLASGIPLSAIVQQTEKIPDNYQGDTFLFYAKMKAHKLYNKYIKGMIH